MTNTSSDNPATTTKRRKLPACEPCRFAKIACDHGQPICVRCVERDRTDECIYRSKPFKKRRGELAPSDRVLSQPSYHTHAFDSTNHISNTSSVLPTRPHRYPNPGFLGRSSHTTLFGHISPDEDGFHSTIDRHQQSDRPDQLIGSAQLARGTQLIDRFYQCRHISACLKLVKTWLATGANLALAGPFTEQCNLTVEQLLLVEVTRPSAVELSSTLYRFSYRPLKVDATTTLESFCAQFTGNTARWETLAFFCISVSRALLACHSWIMPAFDSFRERREMQIFFMHLADACIDICLSLDCLKDLHLILEYECYILHSLIDGDQSFETWRKLGDLVSCALALGYHEGVDTNGCLPDFVKSLRRTAYAYSYTADKNMSIFLGRPSRIHPKFSRFNMSGSRAPTPPDNRAWPVWEPGSSFDFQAEAWWSAACAAIKEEILHLSSKDSNENRIEQTGIILTEIQSGWASLPSHFRLDGRLKTCNRTSLEIDLLLDVRLNYLHILFLLRLALMRNIFEPDDELFAIASDMFALVIEAVMLKDKVAHGSTSLVWKVAYYGLASAGTICLSLLQPSFTAEQQVSTRFKIFQNLAILVAEVESGTLVTPEDANYALLARATQTITSVLQRMLSGRGEHQLTTYQNLSGESTPQPPVASIDEVWSPWRDSNFQEFEANFWHTLAEHPFLIGDETEMQDLDPV